MSLVDLGKRLLEAARKGQDDEVRSLMANGAPFTTDWVSLYSARGLNSDMYLTSNDNGNCFSALAGDLTTSFSSTVWALLYS